MQKRVFFIVFIAAALVSPTAAFAYVGPGAGLSLLGALWALIAAIATALMFVLAWPIRRMLHRRRTARALDGSDRQTDAMSTRSDLPHENRST
ncbi:hypothetical protein [Rhodoligotrophos defluvii]|uniref:hypothetical protein n=1 Tax=Rhodoligotrophos defluvii TaxID=2561934 RepID=UPI00195F53D3|nr:hypothetical protein [Rhodoligotrophos defluvii]